MVLDHFVLFSSISALFGNPSQANYAVANQLLYAVAQQRIQIGNHAKVLSLAPVADSGVLASKPQLLAALMSQGIKPLSLEQFEGVLEQCVQSASSRVCVAHMDWNLFARATRADKDVRFKHVLISRMKDDERVEETKALQLRRALINAKDSLEREVFLSALLRDEIARIIGVTDPNYVFDKPMHELGLDSLMAMQLRMFINSTFRLDITYRQVITSDGLSDLTRLILARVDTNHRSQHAYSPSPEP
jgi:hypothetical protein